MKIYILSDINKIVYNVDRTARVTTLAITVIIVTGPIMKLEDVTPAATTILQGVKNLPIKYH